MYVFPKTEVTKIFFEEFKIDRTTKKLYYVIHVILFVLVLYIHTFILKNIKCFP